MSVRARQSARPRSDAAGRSGGVTEPRELLMVHLKQGWVGIVNLTSEETESSTLTSLLL